ncbi:angiotensin-converting enzyme [Scaptodrosophila lebanonensis]|uniref:Angiotensin-converting enzyme n=1 Tax=Drosophila lebanonensis TaxID=7225 RepID=A0A6J2TZS5_DROLE|nr:angiotensin-converting enzyme [Scaptodrosophila lebanonensis]
MWLQWHGSVLLRLLVVAGSLTLAAGSPPRNLTRGAAMAAKNYEEYAKNTLEFATQRMRNIWSRRRDIFLSLTVKGRPYSAVNQAPLKQEIELDNYRLAYELAANLSVVPVRQLQDPLLRRRVQRLSKLQLHGLRRSDFDQSRELLHTMQTFISGRSVCHAHHQDDCQQSLAMYPHIMNQAVRSQRVEELEYYWLKWRMAINDKNTAKATFIDYVRLLRIAATYNGHVTPSRTWYLYYDTENFQRELEDVVWEVMPLYRELHAYLRKQAILTYPHRNYEEDGSISAPVLDQMIGQAWYPHPIFRVPFPNSQLPSVHQRLEQVLVTSLKINKKAAEFFESLGLNHMSDGFYEKYSRRMNDDELSTDCKSVVYYFPPEVALRYCPKLDYKKMMQMHATMSDLQYNIYKKELPFGLDTEPCPGFGSAMGEAAIIASGTPRHLHRLHILLNESLNHDQSMNRLFRMGVHTLLAVPQYFINDKFLVDVMDGRINVQDYNCAYWRLQNKYAGVAPPKMRNEKSFDPDFKFYRGLSPERSSTMKFISEVLGFQFYRAFCLASGQYQPGNPEYPLHNCDFYGSTEAGKMLREMMQLGATKHWRDIMEIATGERKLSGRGILEYFGPLFTWLKEENKRLDLEPGWDSSTMCRND